jgi:hypothetical protein
MDPALIHGPSFYRFYIPFLLLRTVSKTVDDTYTIHWGKRYCMDLYIESLYGSYEMQPVSKVVTQKVLDIVSREVSDLCFRKKLSIVLRKNWEG